MIDTKLKDKHILITGASSGIGEELVRRFNKQGAIVVMVARNEAKLKRILLELEGQAYMYPCDLTKTEEIENIFNYCKEQGFKLDGLVHSAGISKKIPIRAMTLENMHIHMTTHYYSYVALGKYFASKKYSNDGGSIVAISSIASLLCEKGMSQYSASKAAVNAVTKTMSKEFAKRHIRVNAVAPAMVDTGMLYEAKNEIENFYDELKNKQPLGVIPIMQVVFLVEFLLSDASRYITGSIIPISGGMG